MGSVGDGLGDPAGDGDGLGVTVRCGVLPSPGVGLACVARGDGVGVGVGRCVAGAVACESVRCPWETVDAGSGRNIR